MNWQSSSCTPARRKAATSQASATLDASGTRLNIDSPQNTRSNPTPYSPPTSLPSCQHSIEWAWPQVCSWR